MSCFIFPLVLLTGFIVIVHHRLARGKILLALLAAASTPIPAIAVSDAMRRRMA
jgi:hypothetical protein